MLKSKKVSPEFLIPFNSYCCYYYLQLKCNTCSEFRLNLPTFFKNLNLFTCVVTHHMLPSLTLCFRLALGAFLLSFLDLANTEQLHAVPCVLGNKGERGGT